MSERWRTELRRIDRLHPDDDLVERAMARPFRPETPPSKRVKIGTIAFALIVPIAAIYAAFVVGTTGSITPPADDSVATTPSNGELLYTKRLRDGWHLFALDPETGAERQITQGHRDYGSDWSPDGTMIVYDSESPEGGKGIWVANADGSGATMLIDNGSVPAWSPDGTKIAFARSGNGEISLGVGIEGTPFSLFVMHVDGTNVRRLTGGPALDYSPEWAPDGTQIAFERHGTEGGLFAMSANGSDVRRIADPGIEIFGAPAWSPDGSFIAVAVNPSESGPPGGIMLLPADGGGEGTMIPGTEVEYPDYVSDPAWSPDGEWIAFIHGGLVIQRLDGSNQRTLNVDPETDTIEQLEWGVAPSGVSPAG